MSGASQDSWRNGLVRLDGREVLGIVSAGPDEDTTGHRGLNSMHEARPTRHAARRLGPGSDALLVVSAAAQPGRDGATRADYRGTGVVLAILPRRRICTPADPSSS